MAIIRRMLLLLVLFTNGCNELPSLSDVDWSKSTVAIGEREFNASELPPSVICMLRDVASSYLADYSIDMSSYAPNVMVYERGCTINFLEDGVVVNVDGCQYSRKYKPIELKLYITIKENLSSVRSLNQ